MTNGSTRNHDARIAPIQVSLWDYAGGADRIAMDLHRHYLSEGLDAHLLVGFRKRSDSPAVDVLPNDARRCAWQRMLLSGNHSSGTLRSLIANPVRTARNWLGYTDYDFPGTTYVSELAAATDNPVIHVQNPFGGFFDLRQLPHMSHSFPLVYTLHDMMAFTGYCMHDLGCGKWRTGCGQCPQLSGESKTPHITPRDKTATNWLKKRSIFSTSRIYLTTPSRWLMNLAQESFLAGGIRHAAVIPNGVDDDVFSPVTNAEKQAIRQKLGIPQDSFVFAFSGISSHRGRNPFKDVGTAIDALSCCAAEVRRHDKGKHPAKQLTLLLIGDLQFDGHLPESVQVIRTGYLTERMAVATHLQAADALVHTSPAENFPVAILEAQSCGLPVVASKVGGIPEMVLDGETGFLIEENAPEKLISCMQRLMVSDELRHLMGRAARKRVLENYTMKHMAHTMFDFYYGAKEDWMMHAGGGVRQNEPS
ncbi:MAG: glycosyltransferase [Actinomycetes bacterium]|jgi:glycosyltransferase involved in cell wall biosynthesis|nr:glycosyltransferase [Actinomycetes bacterium]